MIHKYTVEILRHYQCCTCKRWWSVGDHQNPNDAQGCPHCGTWAETKKKNGVEKMVEKIKLGALTLLVVIFCAGCLTGSTFMGYENKRSEKSFEYERDGKNASSKYEDADKKWEIERRPGEL